MTSKGDNTYKIILQIIKHDGIISIILKSFILKDQTSIYAFSAYKFNQLIMGFFQPVGLLPSCCTGKSPGLALTTLYRQDCDSD